MSPPAAEGGKKAMGPPPPPPAKAAAPPAPPPQNFDPDAETRQRLGRKRPTAIRTDLTEDDVAEPVADD
eukprot:5570252-Alexandrium_andersonii.AAC.1